MVLDKKAICVTNLIQAACTGCMLTVLYCWPTVALQPRVAGCPRGTATSEGGLFQMRGCLICQIIILSILIFLKNCKWIKISIKILLILTQNPKCQYINYLSTYQTSLSRWADGQTRARGSFGGRSSVSEPPHLSFTDVFLMYFSDVFFISFSEVFFSDFFFSDAFFCDAIFF